MPSACAVATCRTNITVARKVGEHISLFRFPKDEQLKQKWIKFCKRTDEINLNIARICSRHFRVNDFLRDHKAELLNEKPKRRLRTGAIPTLMFGVAIESENPVINLINEQETAEKLPDDPDERLRKEVLKLKSENNDLKLELANKKQEMVKCKQKLQSALRQVRGYQQRNLKNSENVKDVLKKFRKVFTPNQMNVIMERKKRINWTDEEMLQAHNLHHLSKESYVYLRNTLNFPLPGISTLQGWTSQFHFAIE